MQTCITFLYTLRAHDGDLTLSIFLPPTIPQKAVTSNVKKCSSFGSDDRQASEDYLPNEPKYGSLTNLATFNFNSMSWILREEDVDARNLYITAAHGDVSAAKNLVRGNRLRVKRIRCVNSLFKMCPFIVECLNPFLSCCATFDVDLCCSLVCHYHQN